ncbi:MAG: VanZ family protein [Nitrospinae bacterium]|nr:VanZ family protein [Nitrospinota bacterium]MBF0634530.1 VanZ family protein [Nitrospinota bacterium]
MNLFTDRFKASLATSLYVIGLYITTGVVGTLQLWLRQHGLQRTVSATLLCVFVVLVVYLVVVRLNRRSVGDIAALVAAGLVYAYLIKTYAKAPSDWIHLIEYPPLAVIAYYTLKLSVSGSMAFVYAMALTTAVGAGDEFLQSYVPARTADLHDFIVNVISSAVSLAVVWIVIERKEKVVES